MSPQPKLEVDFSIATTRRSLTHLFGEFERARDERDAADARLARFAETIYLLLDNLPPSAKAEMSARFEEIRSGVPQGRSGDVFGKVIALFRDDPRPQWTIPDIQAALEDRGTAPSDPKALYNAIAYMAKAGRLQRIARGQYVVIAGPGVGAGIELEGFDDGTARTSEHDGP